MEEIAAALLQLVEMNKQIVQQNKQIVEKLSAIQSDLTRDREERLARKQFKAKAFRELDIQYIMKNKNVDAEEAAARLEEYGYDVAKAVRRWGGHSEVGLERVLIHYAKKKNRAAIEMW